MKESEYLESRVENQINWYGDKSTTNKHFYYFFKTIEISFAALVPFLIAISDGRLSFKIITGILAMCIAIFSGILVVYKFQEKWIQYRSTSESLKHEKFLYETNSGIYTNNKKFEDFVERIEFLISKENSEWTQIVVSKEAKQENLDK
jgi:hypothetical protein